jgi:pilus assembly protein CpaB
VNRKVLGVAAAVLLAVVGTFVLASYVQDAEDSAQSDEELVDVLVVSSSVDAGTPAEDLTNRVHTEQVPQKIVANKAVSDLGSLDGRVAAIDLVAGEQLVSTRFVVPAKFDDRRTAIAKVPDGLHEVTIALDPQRALGGKLQAGDTVGFTASFDQATAPPEEAADETAPPNSAVAPIDADPLDLGDISHITLHKVIVTDVSLTPSTLKSYDDVEVSDDDPTGTTPDGLVYVTLAGDAPSVERIIFAAEFGTIWLSYEPAGASESGTNFVTRDNVYTIKPLELEDGEAVVAAKLGGE